MDIYGSVTTSYGSTATDVYGYNLAVGADGVLTNTSGGTISELTVGSNQSNTHLDVSATTNFSIGNFTVQQGTSFGVILPSASGAIFTLGKFSLNPTLTYLGTETFTLEDFANDIFKISDSSNLNIIDKSILEVTTGSKTNTFTLIAKDSEGQTLPLPKIRLGRYRKAAF